MSPEHENPGLERVRHQLRASGVKDAKANPLRSGLHSRGYLPHLKHEGAEYFVTFRLADSLRDTKAANHVGGQLLRSGTSPLPNHAEAQAAESRDGEAHCG